MSSPLIEEENEPISQINIVPFVDIILVVLIVFMVAAPLISRHSLSIRLPEATSGDKSDFSPFHVEIDSKGKIFVEGKKMKEEDLSARAKQALESKALRHAVLSADKEVPHGRVVRIISLLKAAGIQKFSISVEKN